MKLCLKCRKFACACKHTKEMPRQFAVDITLKCDLITASNRDELEQIINNYLDNLAKQEDESITWSEVSWTVSEEN